MKQFLAYFEFYYFTLVKKSCKTYSFVEQLFAIIFSIQGIVVCILPWGYIVLSILVLRRRTKYTWNFSFRCIVVALLQLGAREGLYVIHTQENWILHSSTVCPKSLFNLYKVIYIIRIFFLQIWKGKVSPFFPSKTILFRLYQMVIQKRCARLGRSRLLISV